MVWHNTLQLLVLKRWYDIHKHTMPDLARFKVVWCILHNKSGFSTAKKNIKEIDLIISAFFRKPPKLFVGLSLYTSRKEISAVSYKSTHGNSFTTVLTWERNESAIPLAMFSSTKWTILKILSQRYFHGHLMQRS